MKKRSITILSVILSVLMLLPYVSAVSYAAADTAAAFAATGCPSESMSAVPVQDSQPSFNYPLTYRQESFTVPPVKRSVKKSVTAPSVKSGTLPASFDLRNIAGSLPAVRDQNPYGTCWAFSTIIAAESDMIRSGLADSSIDLSELNVVYNTYRKVSDPLGNFTGDYNVIQSGKTMMDVGGNGQLSTLSLARWGGVTAESVMPYTQGLFACGYDYPNEYSSEMDVAHLQNAYWLNIKSETDAIKEFVMAGNAVGMAYWNNEADHNNTYHSYYQNMSIDTNHAVAIVGWNDNFSRDNFNEGKKPAVDGAWLIRNSWGEGFGDNGCFWLSYADASLEYGTAYVFNFESADNYDRNYQYDGSVGMSSFSASERSSLTTANVYTAQGNETLKAVSFMNPKNTNVDYTVKVYLNPVSSNEPSSGTLVSTQSGTETYCGYHTVKLTSPVNLAEDDSFAVSVTLTDRSGDDLWIAYEDTYDYNWMKSVAAYSSGQSFVSYDGGYNWFDFGTLKHGNCRIKAFTDVQAVEAPTGLKTVMSEEGAVTLSWNDASGAISYEVYKKGENEGEYSLLASPDGTQYTYTPDYSGGVVILYRVKAVDADGTSDYSKAASVSLPIIYYVYRFDMSCNDDYGETTVRKGDTAQIVTAIESTKATDKLIAFSSDNSNVATVDLSGLVTAVGYGNSTITGVSRNGNHENSIIIRVPETINVMSLNQMQSAHNYKEGTEQIYVYTKANADSVSVTFSEDTYLTSGRDYIKVYNANDVLQGTYTANQLANRTVTVQGDTFKLRLQTDALGGDYGFRATSITYTGGDMDTALLTQYMNEAEALTQSDYTTASWASLQQTLTSAEALFTNPSATQDDIDNAAQAVRTAIDTLEECVKIQRISITAEGAQNDVLKLIVPAGQAYTSVGALLTLAVEPAGATYQSIKWESSDFFIGVNESGYVSAAWDSAAYTTVKATVTDEAGTVHTDEIIVAIMHYDTQKVTLLEKTLNLVPGNEEHKITASVTDNNGNNADIYDLTWTSDNKDVATVSRDGTVTAVGNGTAKIRATADFGGAYDECIVTVGEHTHSYKSTVIQPTCTQQGYSEYTCDCGDTYKSDYVPAAGHKWSVSSSVAATCHTYSVTAYECSVCRETKTETGTAFDTENHDGESEVRGIKSATCAEAGYTGDTYCLGCAAKTHSGSATAATGLHTPSAPAEENRTEPDCGNAGHYDSVVYCSVCNNEISRESKTIPATENHSWHVTSSTAATCHTYSVTAYECSVCHVTKTETGTAFDTENHDGGSEVRGIKSATCAEEGYTGDTYCLGCAAKTHSGFATAATGLHTPSAPAEENRTEPDCGNAGHYDSVVYCSVCNNEISRESKNIPATENHSWHVTSSTAATCHTYAVTAYECSVCHETKTETGTAFDTENHDGGSEVRDARAADCTADGYTGDTYCKGCNEKLACGEAVTKIGHKPETGNFLAPSCKNTGYTGDTYCTVCGILIAKGEVTAKLSHTVVEDAAVDATCTLPGKTAGSHCSVCGETITAQQIIAAKGHSYDGGTAIEPACTSSGYTEYRCTICGDTYRTDEISALGHTDSDGNGSCDVCGVNLHAECSCMCHSTSAFTQFFYKIACFFWKLFGIKKVCDCGKNHY